MPRAKQVISKAVGISRKTGVLALIGLVFGWSGPVLSADETEAEPTLQLAPIRLGFNKFGAVDYLLRYDKLGTSNTMRQTLGLTVGVGVRAETFIWQPWIAQVGTHVNASVGSELTDSARDSMKMARSDESFYRVISGGAGLRLLPRSRFPFEASFSRHDNRREVGLIKTEYATLTDTLKLSQAYRNRSGRSRYLLTYNLSRAEDQNSQVNSSRLLNFDVSLQPTRQQSLRINAVKGYADNTFMGSTVLNNSLISSHTYRPNSAFSLATFASLTSTNYRLTLGETGQEALQFSSAVTWRDGRLTMTGGVRLFEASNSNNGITTPGETYTGANLGANYALTDWFRLYGSVNVYDSNGAQTVTSTTISNLSAAVQHRPKMIRLGNFNYNRFIAANLSNNTNSVTASATTPGSSATYQTFTLRLQHSLDNSTQLGAGNLKSSLSQGLTTTANSNSLPGARLNHGGVLTWLKGGGLIRLSANDSREMSGTKSYFQSVNLQGSQSERLKGSASLRGDLTVNASRQGYNAAPIPTTDSLTSTASLHYINGRAFGVRNMVFRSTLQVVSADLLQSNGQNTQNQGRYTWENELTYAIGKVKAELKGLLEEVQSSKRASLMFHVNREF